MTTLFLTCPTKPHLPCSQIMARPHLFSSLTHYRHHPIPHPLLLPTFGDLRRRHRSKDHRPTLMSLAPSTSLSSPTPSPSLTKSMLPSPAPSKTPLLSSPSPSRGPPSPTPCHCSYRLAPPLRASLSFSSIPIASIARTHIHRHQCHCSILIFLSQPSPGSLFSTWPYHFSPHLPHHLLPWNSNRNPKRGLEPDPSHENPSSPLLLGYRCSPPPSSKSPNQLQESKHGPKIK